MDFRAEAGGTRGFEVELVADDALGTRCEWWGRALYY
jgi:hypothetical protein